MKKHLFGLLLALLGMTASAQPDFSKVEVRAERLAPGTYMLSGAGGNLGLSVGDDAVFVIDSEYAALAPKIKEAIAKITPKPVRFVLNTHFHFDHAGGNEAFGGDGALIVAHDNVRRRLASDQLISFLGRSNRQAATGKAGLPVVTVPGEVTFHVNGDEVHAFHVPRAHTDGDLIVHLKKSDVIHMGDVFFNGMYPFIDAGSGGTPEGTVAAFDRVLAIAGPATKIIPGHGRLATRDDLRATRDMLAAVIARIQELRRAGRSDEEIRAAKPSEPFDARFGGGFVRPEAFVQMLLGAMAR